MLAMIALLIGYEAVSRLIAPVPIAFEEAIPIAVLGLVVNIASVRLLSGGNHGRGGRNEVSLSQNRSSAEQYRASPPPRARWPLACGANLAVVAPGIGGVFSKSL